MSKEHTDRLGTSVVQRGRRVGLVQVSLSVASWSCSRGQISLGWWLAEAAVAGGALRHCGSRGPFVRGDKPDPYLGFKNYTHLTSQHEIGVARQSLKPQRHQQQQQQQHQRRRFILLIDWNESERKFFLMERTKCWIEVEVDVEVDQSVPSHHRVLIKFDSRSSTFLFFRISNLN